MTELDDAMNAQNVERSNPMALAVAVSDRVQIHDVRLVRSESRQAPTASRVKNFHVRMQARTDVQVNEQTNRIAVFAHFECLARDSAKPADSEAEVHVSADFVIFYTVPSLSGLTKENLDKFGELNGTFNAWPYWREYLHSTIARMGLKPFILPVFRIAMSGGPETGPIRRTDGAGQLAPTE